MSAFVNEHRNRTTADGLKWGVEPICAVLPIAPSTYFAAKTRTPSRRAMSATDVRDAWLTGEIRRVHAANYGVYGGRTEGVAPAQPRRCQRGPLQRGTAHAPGRTPWGRAWQLQGRYHIRREGF